MFCIHEYRTHSHTIDSSSTILVWPELNDLFISNRFCIISLRIVWVWLCIESSISLYSSHLHKDTQLMLIRVIAKFGCVGKRGTHAGRRGFSPIPSEALIQLLFGSEFFLRKSYFCRFCKNLWIYSTYGLFWRFFRTTHLHFLNRIDSGGSGQILAVN